MDKNLIALAENDREISRLKDELAFAREAILNVTYCLSQGIGEAQAREITIGDLKAEVDILRQELGNMWSVADVAKLLRKGISSGSMYFDFGEIENAQPKVDADPASLRSYLEGRVRRFSIDKVVVDSYGREITTRFDVKIGLMTDADVSWLDNRQATLDQFAHSEQHRQSAVDAHNASQKELEQAREHAKVLAANVDELVAEVTMLRAAVAANQNVAFDRPAGDGRPEGDGNE